MAGGTAKECRLRNVTEFKTINAMKQQANRGNAERMNSTVLNPRGAQNLYLFTGKPGNHFIRLEESFLGQPWTARSTEPTANDPSDWMQAILPLQPTVKLQSPDPDDAAAGGAVWGSTPGGRPSSSAERPSSAVFPANPEPVAAARRMVRYSCRTCGEKLPTLNSLRTHLKSHHFRPSPYAPPASFLSAPSQVVTSKYGRRRAVISALVAANPWSQRR
ncbi:uncharacterized protein [Hetaerina americana]|uniref:uncharacterized protein n=1 Tax=Hetaerina americana TaxID=62018 RepID=UPI003A7F25A9